MKAGQSTRIRRNIEMFSSNSQYDWLMNPSTILSFTLEDEDSLVIRPQKLAVDWKKIEALRAKTLKMKGASSESTVSFLRRDRQSH